MSAVRKTLTYLGLVDPEEETYYEEPMLSITTPSRKITSRSRYEEPTAPNQIATIHPKQYSDARIIAENYRLGIPVIIDLHQMTETSAKRLIDFCSGMVMGLEGKIERVTSKVFLLTPFGMNMMQEGHPADTGIVDTQFFNND